MTISETLNNAIKDLKESNLLNFERVLSTLLRESSKNAELCQYIEDNGEKVNMKKEMISYFNTGKFNSDNPQISIPFLYSLLYLLDMKKISPEDIVSHTFPKLEINTAYTLFASSISKALLANLEKVILSNLENADSASEKIDKDTLNAFFYMKSYVRVCCDDETSERLTSFADYLFASLKTGNKDYIYGLYRKLENAVNIAGLDSACLNGIKDAIENSLKDTN